HAPQPAIATQQPIAQIETIGCLEHRECQIVSFAPFTARIVCIIGMNRIHLLQNLRAGKCENEGASFRPGTTTQIANSGATEVRRKNQISSCCLLCSLTRSHLSSEPTLQRVAGCFACNTRPGVVCVMVLPWATIPKDGGLFTQRGRLP